MVEGKVISIGNVAYVLGMAVKKLHRWYQNVLSGFKQAEEQGHIGKDDLEVYQDGQYTDCLLYTSPSPRDGLLSRMPSSA